MKVLTILALLCLSHAVTSNKIVNCYWGTWANYRLGDGKFTSGNIDPHLCTHISYTFFGISDAGEIKSLDTWLDFDLGFISQTIGLKHQNPNLKVLAVVGGWNEGSTKYSAMAADPNKRALFISSTLSFIQQNGFDGLDLDWEYPGQRGGAPEDKQNFVTLLREIKQAFAPHGYELGIATGASEASAQISYDIPAISEHLDFINVMTYDFHMASDGYLGFNAPMPEVQAAIDYWINAGAPAHKVILGLGAYGHTYQMADSSQHQPGAASIGPGSAGPYTGTNGFLGYNEVCVNSNWQVVFDGEAQSPYAYQGSEWIGYDNPQSIEIKMNLVQSRNLGGAMVWSIETDDFRGLCGESYPLLKTINRALGNHVDDNGNNGNVTPAPTPAPTPDGGNNGGNGEGNGDCTADGYFRQADNCSKFYQCVGGVRYDFECGSGLYFDTTSHVCDFPENVDC